MLILQLNVVLVYIFKVASACNWFWFCFRIYFKALPGLMCRQKRVLRPFPRSPCQQMVPDFGMLQNPVPARMLVPPGWGHLNTEHFLPPHLACGTIFGQAHECFSVPPTKITAAAMPRWRLYLSCLNKWEVRGYRRRKVKLIEEFLNSSSSCSVALRPFLQKQRQLLTSGFLHNR